VLRPDRTHRHRSRWLAAGVVAALGTALVAAPRASAATTPSVNLKLLVIDRANASTGVFDTTTRGVEAELTREGVPFDVVTPAQANAFTTASLEDAANHRALYQGVIMADPFEIDSTAMNIIKDVETRYGLRHVNTDAFPNPDAEGLAPVAAATTLDGNLISVTAAGKADVFGYLAGSVTADDNDKSLAEAQVYVTHAAAPAKAGTTFTSLLDIKVGTATGSLASVYTDGGREQLTLTAAGSDDQMWLRALTPGVISWVTRGINLGFHRSYFGLQVDDVFLPDSRYSATGHCTPGDGCVDPTVTTTDIRMTDNRSNTDVQKLVNGTKNEVQRLVDWTKAHGFAVDLAFNGAGSVQAAGTGRNGTDALLTAFQRPGVGDLFRWVNHTYTHTFLGCIQIAPTTIGSNWRCATPADTTGFEDAALAADATDDTTNNIKWLSLARVSADITQNVAWATTAKLPNFNPTVLVTGEHSGLTTTPQQPIDNPNLASALTAAGIVVTASDASRETGPRTVGTTQTLPRHPMNIFYNAGTFQDEVSEYNWIYAPSTTADPNDPANTGGNCTNSSVTTCMATPLDASSDAAAKTSFTNYILPIEIRNAMRDVVAGDPRPFYAHQSNLAEDGILYPVLEGILSSYRSMYDTTKSPLVNPDMKAAEQALHRADASAAATAYVDATGVHMTAPLGAGVPLTVPASGTGTTGLTAYDTGLSGWVAGTGSDAVVATLNPAGGGYKVAPPAAPTNVTAVADITSATVTWTPSPVNLADVTGWTITATGTPAVAAIPLKPADVKPGPTAGTLSYTIRGLKAGASYTFDVFGTNAIGDGPHSTPSPSVTILGLPTAPTVTATAGDGTATVTWTPGPEVTGHAVAGYVVTQTDGTTPVVLTATPLSATTTTLPVTGLTDGTAYTFMVAAVNDLGTGPAGTSAAVTPMAPAPIPTPEPPAPAPGGGGGGGVPAPPAPVAPDAPTLGTVKAGNAKIDLTWTAPASDGGSPITGYVVTAYKAGDGTVAGTMKTSDTSAAFTGLINGIGYTVEVAAENVVGVGPASARSAVLTPSTVPAKVIGVSVKRGAASLAVRWKAPANGGSALTGYVVTAYVAKGGKTAATVKVPAKLLAATVKGLKNGTGYTVDVRAINANGPGVASARSSVVVPATTPGRPSIKATKAGKRGGRSTALVAWRAPSTDGGAAVTGYRITATKYSARGRVLGRTVVTIKSGKVRSAELRLAGGTYRFTVRAVNAVGVGLASGSSKPTVAR
jgi:hypothetical protein